MPGRAAAVRGLTVAGADGVQIADVGHQLQGAIDRGQSDAFPVMSQIVVNLLRGSEVVSIRQDLFDRCALASLALTRRTVWPVSAFAIDLVVISVLLGGVDRPAQCSS